MIFDLQALMTIYKKPYTKEVKTKPAMPINAKTKDVVLEAISKNPGISSSELLELTGLSPAATYRATKFLTDKAIIIRTRISNGLPCSANKTSSFVVA